MTGRKKTTLRLPSIEDDLPIEKSQTEDKFSVFLGRGAKGANIMIGLHLIALGINSLRLYSVGVPIFERFILTLILVYPLLYIFYNIVFSIIASIWKLPKTTCVTILILCALVLLLALYVIQNPAGFKNQNVQRQTEVSYNPTPTNFIQTIQPTYTPDSSLPYYEDFQHGVGIWPFKNQSGNKYHARNGKYEIEISNEVEVLSVQGPWDIKDGEFQIETNVISHNSFSNQGYFLKFHCSFESNDDCVFIVVTNQNIILVMEDLGNVIFQEDIMQCGKSFESLIKWKIVFYKGLINIYCGENMFYSYYTENNDQGYLGFGVINQSDFESVAVIGFDNISLTEVINPSELHFPDQTKDNSLNSTPSSTLEQEEIGALYVTNNCDYKITIFINTAVLTTINKNETKEVRPPGLGNSLRFFDPSNQEHTIIPAYWGQRLNACP